MSDYKYEMQLRAEEMAEEDGKDYFKLTPDEQCQYYEKATTDWTERKYSAAERLEER